MQNVRKIFIVLIGICLVLSVSKAAFAEAGVTDTEIFLGQSAALDGPAKALGLGMKAGMEAYFGYINDQGGVNGRKITLRSYDDGYEPQQCIKHTEMLINTDVFALIGYVGTPTSKAVVPIIEAREIPYIGPFTGAEFLRNPVKHHVINIRGSYFDETEGLVRHLVDDLGIKKIACFYQNDSYGKAGLTGVILALKRRDMKLAAEGTYERNQVNVQGAALKIKMADPGAVIMIGAYTPCTAFIKSAKQIGMGDAKFCNISFVGSAALKNALGSDGEGVIISQVVPFPWDKSIPLVAEYHTLLEKYSPRQEPGFVSLEGFMVAKFFVQALEACGKDLTREGLISAIETKGKFDLDGITLTFGPDDHQGMDDILFTKIEGDSFKEFKVK